MTELFLTIVNMSISATYLVLAVVALRFLLKKAPKWVNVLLWGLVALRLICPFTLESALSLIPSAEVISPEILTDPSPTIHTGIEAVNSVVNPVLEESFSPVPGDSANPLQVWLPVLSGIWVTGMALMLLYTLGSYRHLHRQVKMAIRVKDNIYLSEFVSSPFVLGVFRPKIYLPYHMSEQDRHHVLAHERAHIRRKDHWWKPLGFLLLTLHWFNPFLWLAYVLLCRDIEFACDEKVIKELGTGQRADYSQALLNCSVDHKTIAACPVAFGEVGVKERVKNVLTFKKPAFWVILISVLVCITVAVCFLTDPKESTPFGETYHVESIIYDAAVYDFSYTPETAPLYSLTDERKLRILEDTDSDHWGTAGTFRELTLTEETFDRLFWYEEIWKNGQSPSSLRQSNEKAWSLLVAPELSNTTFYYLLLQEKGDLYLCWGHNQPDSENGIIRSVFRLEAETDTMTVDFGSMEFRHVTQIKLVNGHNGNITYISDPEQINAICAFLQTVSGTNGTTSRGIYEGSYSVTLTTSSGDISIGFGDTEHIFYGDYGDGYPVMYNLVNRNISEVVSFFQQYDTSNHTDPGTVTPWTITSALTAEDLRGSADYLIAGGGYNFFDYMDEEIVSILNSLTEADFLPSPGITPDTTITLSQGTLEISLNSDGEYVEFSFDTKTAEALVNTVWAVKNDALNGFFTMMNSYSPENSTYEIYNVAPLEDLPRSYNLEEATIDKCVILIDGDVRDNQEVWEEFISKVTSGAEATVRYVTYFSGSENEASQMFIHDLTFDGTSFTLRWFEDGTEYIRNYAYLQHFFGEAEPETASYDAYDYYVLTNEAGSTWEELWRSTVSSQSGDAIDYQLVYTDLIYYVKHPEVPEHLTSVTLEQDGNILLTLTDRVSLEALSSLISSAEALGYEPGTYSLGPSLIFTEADGRTVTAQLDWYNDLCSINGEFYDYGPGYTDDGTYDGRLDLFTLLGTTCSDPAELDRILYSISEKDRAERLDALLELLGK